MENIPSDQGYSHLEIKFAYLRAWFDEESVHQSDDNHDDNENKDGDQQPVDRLQTSVILSRAACGLRYDTKIRIRGRLH